MAMQYPPRRRVDPSGADVWLDEVGDDLEEELPQAGMDIGYDLVHFDLDTQNGKSLSVLCVSHQIQVRWN